MGTCPRRCCPPMGARSPGESRKGCNTTYLELGSEDGVVVGRGMPWGTLQGVSVRELSVLAQDD